MCRVLIATTPIGARKSIITGQFLLELAQMLGEVSENTLRSAHEILQSARTASKKK
jgi:hypothetical protein